MQSPADEQRQAERAQQRSHHRRTGDADLIEQQAGDRRTDHTCDRICRLLEAEGLAALIGWRALGDECGDGGRGAALTDGEQQQRSDQQPPVRGRCKHEETDDEHAESVAKHDADPPPLSQPAVRAALHRNEHDADDQEQGCGRALGEVEPGAAEQ